MDKLNREYLITFIVDTLINSYIIYSFLETFYISSIVKIFFFIIGLLLSSTIKNILIGIVGLFLIPIQFIVALFTTPSNLNFIINTHKYCNRVITYLIIGYAFEVDTTNLINIILLVIGGINYRLMSDRVLMSKRTSAYL